MYKITASGSKAAVQAAWDILAWSDPTPADAVDAREETRALWRLDAYAQDEAAAAACADIIKDSSADLSPSIAPVEDKDWVRVSLEGLPAVEAGPFLVAGSHALTSASPGKIPILIEAGPAFGTGHHGTTRGCLLAFDRIRRREKPERVLDVGTGSGVLAIAALKTGSRSAIGTD
ncbi:MAG: 50S ribosomal protein L11 methyltransferase, partial [Pseudomonadota bacterium]